VRSTRTAASSFIAAAYACLTPGRPNWIAPEGSVEGERQQPGRRSAQRSRFRLSASVRAGWPGQIPLRASCERGGSGAPASRRLRRAHDGRVPAVPAGHGRTGADPRSDGVRRHRPAARDGTFVGRGHVPPARAARLNRRRIACARSARPAGVGSVLRSAFDRGERSCGSTTGRRRRVDPWRVRSSNAVGQEPV